MAYAPGDHAVFTSDGLGGGTVAVDNSVGSQVASFKVDGTFQPSQFAVKPGTAGATVVSALLPQPTGAHDILFQNVSGQVAGWEVDGASLTGSALLGANPGPNWKAVGGGDFNGDSEPDILLHNTNGNVAVWETDGTNVTTAAAVANPGSNWKAIGTGDFNDDHHSDILLQNANGAVAIWDMGGTTEQA